MERSESRAAEAKKARNADSRRRRSIKLWKIALFFIILVIAFRIALQYIVLHYVNKSLAEMKEYYGHVEDIDIALFRGAYVIEHINIVRLQPAKNKTDTIPFFWSPNIDLSLEWGALFKGALAGEIVIDRPVINFVRLPVPNKDLRQDTADFRELVRDLMPVTVNRIEVHNGELHYVDPISSPRIDLAMKSLQVQVENITNVNDSAKLLPARMVATASGLGGKFGWDMNFDGLNKVPTFDLNARAISMDLVQMNDFLRATGNFDVKKGRLDLYVEMAAKNGKFGGYIKPIATDLDILQWNKEEGDFKQKVHEAIVAAGAKILENRKADQVATKIPISGQFNDPNLDLRETVIQLLKNAFIQALNPSIEGTININQLQEQKKDRSIWKRIFGGKDDDDEDKKDKKEKDN